MAPLDAPATPAAPAVSTTEATNAKMLTQTVGMLVEQLGSGNADVVAAIEAITAAVVASIIGGTTGGTANRALVSKGTSGFVLQATPVSIDPSTGAVTGASIANAQVQFAASSRALGRNTSGAGAGEEVTFSQILDWVGSAARGDLMRRGASAWERLGIGSNGQVLTSDGTDPAWVSPGAVVTLIAAGAISAGASEVDIALGTHDLVEIDLIAIRPTTDNRAIQARYSQDGSTFLSDASDYSWALSNAGTGAADNADTEIDMTGGIGNAAGEFVTLTARIFRPSAAGFVKSMTWFGLYVTDAGGHVANHGGGRLLANTDAITHVRFLLESASTFAAGHYAARGYRFS